MQDIIKNVNTDDYETFTRDDLMLIMIKAKEIVSWKTEENWKEIYNTLSRFAITAKAGNVDHDKYIYTLGTLFPLIKLIEAYYRDNAALYTKDETEEELQIREAKGMLTDMICKIQTMHQDNWDFETEDKRTLFVAYELGAQGFLNDLEATNNLNIKAYRRFKTIHSIVNKEFCEFWNTMHKI